MGRNSDMSCCSGRYESGSSLCFSLLSKWSWWVTAEGWISRKRFRWKLVTTITTVCANVLDPFSFLSSLNRTCWGSKGALWELAVRGRSVTPPEALWSAVPAVPTQSPAGPGPCSRPWGSGGSTASGRSPALSASLLGAAPCVHEHKDTGHETPSESPPGVAKAFTFRA